MRQQKQLPIAFKRIPWFMTLTAWKNGAKLTDVMLQAPEFALEQEVDSVPMMQDLGNKPLPRAAIFGLYLSERTDHAKLTRWQYLNASSAT